MTLNRFDIARTRRTVFDALLDARRKFGGSRRAMEDSDRNVLTYDKIVLGAFALGRQLAKTTSQGENVGVLIANSNGGVLAVLGLMAFGRTPAMLNFTAGIRNLRSACETGQIKTIVTAKRFVDQANLGGLVDELGQICHIIYLEDVRNNITAIDKARALFDSKLPKLALPEVHPDSAGVVLFTSGTEGTPKGVVLSHTNLVANVEQVDCHVELLTSDVVLNPLPIFHCFGLTGGVILPLLTGMHCVLFPSPLQAKTIVKLCRDAKATILFATDTFVNQYVRQADDGDLSSLRFVVCGAEKVKEETREALLSRFGVPIVEGYGATEAAPVIAVNTPNQFNRPGTVGRLLPGVEWRMESIPGIFGGGRLFVRGPNVMSGYIRSDAPGEVQPLAGGWHDTGDVVEIDGSGYLSIRGRVKRFAKIGGEMVSLSAVETYATTLWPDSMHVALTINDPKKGEQVVLMTDHKGADRATMQAWYKANGAAELALPKKITVVDAIPILGTGKIDYVTAARLLNVLEKKAA